jgi:ubiquinone/menaquinone biosynthesis C-methylase UbiE
MQKDRFSGGEGDAWFRRNRAALEDIDAVSAVDPVIRVIKSEGLRPSKVLEIGAGTGWRLSWIRRAFGCAVTGVEPSRDAIAAGQELDPSMQILAGTADRLPFAAQSVDLVIFGFCLYLCDPQDLFQIAAEADRVLQADGKLIIYDFHAAEPFRIPYAPSPGLFSHKMDFTKLFTWHPGYRLLSQQILAHPGGTLDNPNDITAVSVLLKSGTEGFATST